MSDDTGTVTQEYTIGDEIAHQFVITAFSLVGTIGTVWIMTRMMDAAVWQRVKMRTALAVQATAGKMLDVTWRQLEFWNTIGLAATALYDKEKN